MKIKVCYEASFRGRDVGGEFCLFGHRVLQELMHLDAQKLGDQEWTCAFLEPCVIRTPGMAGPLLLSNDFGTADRIAQNFEIRDGFPLSGRIWA